MNLFKAVYSSTPFGYDAQTLAAILLDARRFNERDGITGALMCRRDIYLQMLEGPEELVRATLGRIRADDRHVNVQLHVAEGVSERLFGDWEMFHSPNAANMWSREAIDDGAIERTTPAEVLGFFKHLRLEAA